MNKIFISHKKEDSEKAESIRNSLNESGVNAYLDLLEGNILLEGEQLTNHIKRRLNDCTDLLVVMSDKTQESWWVPFEIGMASQKDFPIVSYLLNNVKLPDYLNYWPTLENGADLLNYSEAIKNRDVLINESTKGFNNGYFSKNASTKDFYKDLKNRLNH